jgi:hypothetical protein
MGLKVIAQILSYFGGRSAQIKEYERLVKSAILSWEKRTAVSADLRKEHRKIDEELDQKWKETFGSGSDPQPIQESKPQDPEPKSEEKSGRLDKDITGPLEVKAGESFKVYAKVPVGTQIWRDKKWHLITMGDRGEATLILSSPSPKVELWLKIDGVFQENPHIMKVIA